MKKRLVALVIALLASHAMVSCDSRHVVERPDTTRPTVVSITPVDNATGVVVTTAVTVAFSEAMDASSISDASFSVTSATTGTVSGTVTYDAVSNVATFTTSSAMTHDTAYTANIAADAKDLAGNSLASAFNWSFTTIPAPGALDRTFGTGGLVRTAVGNGNDVGAAVALQPDGKIVVAGYSTVVTAITSSINSIAISFTLARYNPNGSLDTSFGLPLNTGGKVTDFSGEARSVAIQPDGKILAAGTNGTGADFLIVRYNSDGQIDTGFGTSGQAVIDMGGNFDVVNALALQSDGKIVVVGDKLVTAPSLTANNSAIARLNADGTLDTSFNGTGTIINTLHDNSWTRAVKIQPDGKILVAGNFQNTGGLVTPFITRYDQFGALDAGFNGTGTVTPSPGQDAGFWGISVLPDGKILAAGATTNTTTNFSDIFLVRYNADGAPDSTFGPDGTGSVFTDFNAGDEGAVAVGVDAGGKILVAATYRKTSGQPLTTDFAVFRYNADGVLDLTFGNGFGMVHPDFGGNLDDIAHAMQIQTDGKIVVVGGAGSGSNSDIGLARYWP